MTAPRPFMAVGVPAVSDRISISRSAGRLSGLQIVRASPSACQYTSSGRLTASFIVAPAPSVADMFDAAAQLLEDRHRPGDIGLRAADQAEQLAFLRRRRAAADRTFDKCGALLQHRGADRLHRVRAHRAHVDHELAGEFGFQNAVRSAVDRLGCGVVQQHHDDGLAALDEFRGRGEQLCAGIDQRLCLCRIAIPDADLVSDRHQSLRDR